jgi:diguanylate cyclase (GGDEF)-like protein
LKELEGTLITRDGRSFPAMIIASPIVRAGSAAGMVVAFRDITESKRAWEELGRLNKELEHQARTDGLTGIANRRQVVEDLRGCCALALRYGTPCSVMLFDIDWFKRINDRFGHEAGDDALRFVAGVIQAQLRQSDVLGRWGGEEFIVILPQTRLAEAAELATRLCKALGATAEPRVGRITASFGVVEHHPGESPDETIARSDHLLYEAKRLGRDRVVAEEVDGFGIERRDRGNMGRDPQGR